MDNLIMRLGEDKAQKGDLREAVIEYVTAKDWVTLAEIQEFLAPYMEVKGEAQLSLVHDRNIILWAGMSEEFADFLHGLWGDPSLVLDACSPMAYMMDGGMLNLPIAKRPPKHGYKEPHWAPICLRPRSAVD